MLLLALGSVTAIGAPSAADRASAQKGADWLEGQSSTTPGQQADRIVALRASGVSSRGLRVEVRALAASGRQYGTRAGAAAKVARAAKAVGANPRRFGKVNYLGRINRDYRSGRYGTTAYDQALAMIALRESGQRVPRQAVLSLARARGNGGWNLGLSRSGPDDVDATAIVIEAMRAAGVSKGNRGLRSALTWMRAQAGPDGSYPSRSGRAADANSTAAALRALTAMNAPRTRTATALRRFQRPDGSFRWRRDNSGSRMLATLDAVPALLGAGAPHRAGR